MKKPRIVFECKANEEKLLALLRPSDRRKIKEYLEGGENFFLGYYITFFLKGGGSELKRSITPSSRSARVRVRASVRKPKNKIKRFRKPTLQQVKDYCEEKGYAFDVEYFLDYYNSVGWMRGKTKIKSWKMCCSTWNRNEQKRAQTRGWARTIKEEGMETAINKMYNGFRAKGKKMVDDCVWKFTDAMKLMTDRRMLKEEKHHIEELVRKIFYAWTNMDSWAKERIAPPRGNLYGARSLVEDLIDFIRDNYSSMKGFRVEMIKVPGSKIWRRFIVEAEKRYGCSFFEEGSSWTGDKD